MPGDTIRFAIIGLDHNHAYNHARLLLNAGAELAAVYSDEPDDVAAFKKTYPDCPVKSMAEILEDRQRRAVPECPDDLDGVRGRIREHSEHLLSRWYFHGLVAKEARPSRR